MGSDHGRPQNTFWNDCKALNLDWGTGYVGVYVCHNSSNDTSNVCISFYVNHASTKLTGKLKCDQKTISFYTYLFSQLLHKIKLFLIPQIKI